ncbi:MAG: histidine kinase N-terminal 7TM domain-containing protein, partial [Nocardioidaceae bacterium]
SMVAAAVVLAGLAGYVWRRRGSDSALSLAVLLLAVAWWAGAYAIELQTGDLAVRGRWGDLKYLGICLLPPAWLVFVLHYTGRGRFVTRRLLLLLAVGPMGAWVMLAVPATHDLVRYYAPSSTADDIPLVVSGPLFWVILGVANMILLVATAMFVLSMARLSRAYWTTAVVFVAATLLPWAANLLHNFGVGPFARIDLTPFAFIVTGAVLVWGLFRERLINLSSVAWGFVVQTMPDAVFLLDAFGRVIDVNPATVRLVGRARARVIGQQLDQLLPGHPELVDPDRRAVADLEVELRVDGTMRHFDVRRQMLPDPAGARSGELVILRDITARKHDEEQLRDLLAQRSRVASALQASLLPSRLPSVPGCELASVYQPAGDGQEIGGDFFDVFPLAPDRWGLVLGDVSGKGAEAAAVTALIRYTLRTLATAESEPSQVLDRLNDVLLRDCAEEQYATLVYAVVTVAGNGVDLRVCLAGHHPPLLRHRDMRVESVGTLGTALGLLTEPQLHDVGVHVGPGELLCLFTDGLVEARGDDELYGSRRVAAMLDYPAATCLQDVVDRLAAAARDFRHGQLTDDLAVLALCVPPPRGGGDVLEDTRRAGTTRVRRRIAPRHPDTDAAPVRNPQTAGTVT